MRAGSPGPPWIASRSCRAVFAGSREEPDLSMYLYIVEILVNECQSAAQTRCQITSGEVLFIPECQTAGRALFQSVKAQVRALSVIGPDTAGSTVASDAVTQAVGVCRRRSSRRFQRR